MKRVFSSESLADAGNVKAVLENNGIAAFLKNEQLSGAMGEVPFLECSPEVWIYDDRQADEAQAIIAEVLQPASTAAGSWRCESCGETNEGQYAACWRCGAADERA